MEQAHTTRTLLAVIVTVVVFAALKVTQPITLPLAFGAVLLLFFRPLQRRLERCVPHWVGVVVIMLIVLALLGLAAAAVAYAVSVVAPQVPGRGTRTRFNRSFRGCGAVCRAWASPCLRVEARAAPSPRLPAGR